MATIFARSRKKALRFAGDRRGAAAVEFALIALPFFMLLFGTLELGLLFMASTTIESAADTSGRRIRTGELQTSGAATAAAFKTDICNNMSWLSNADCTANLQVDVRTFNNFSTININPPIKAGAVDQTQLQFNPGVSCDVVLVRAYYPYTLYTPLLEPGLPSLNATQRLLTTAIAFRNENWAGVNNCPDP